jgi:beta-galactosidase
VPDAAWQALSLPHTWNQWDATDNTPGYRRDASWYRKDFDLQPADSLRYQLYFEGANMKAEVWLNGRKVGAHVGGYLGFAVDLTPALQAGRNRLAVRVDNGYDPQLIPSQKADFFLYGGLTRDVWLDLLPSSHVVATRISTPQVSAQRAQVAVDVEVSQDPLMTASAVEVAVLAPQTGEVLITQRGALRGEGGTQTLGPMTIETPQLWSPATPQLYTLRVRLLAGKRVLDEQQEAFGLRWFDFTEEGAFRLNGERLLLRGTHRHEEHAGYGAAMPDSLHRRDMAMIKEMGANFVRLGHYPQDPSVYRACDELGLIVWDELPWCRGGLGDATWQAHTKRLLTEQIRQNYNHPSICFWSLGNEVYWLPDFPGGDDTTRLNAFVASLNEIAHDLDPHRYTAMRKYYAGAQLVDVFSPSIWAGWYAGVYTNYEAALRRERAKYPRMLHMEYGGSSHLGRHTETPITGQGLLSESEWAEVANQVNVTNIAQSGDWTESYIVDLFDWHLRVSETLPGFAGNAQWAIKDFGTPLRPENAIPYLNQKGLFDRAGKPKDAYYVFKSYWAEAPFVHLMSHTWTERSGPADKPRELRVYSNCEAVELFHQGQSLGKRQREFAHFPAHNLHWSVLMDEGTNDLLAVGYVGGQPQWRDSLTLQYRHQPSGKPDHIHLEATQLSSEWWLIEAIMQDEAGLRVLDYEGRVYFSADGDGSLAINYGTPEGSQVIEMANGRAAIRLRLPQGRAVIEARNQDFKGSYLTLSAGMR